MIHIRQSLWNPEVQYFSGHSYIGGNVGLAPEGVCRVSIFIPAGGEPRSCLHGTGDCPRGNCPVSAKSRSLLCYKPAAGFLNSIEK